MKREVEAELPVKQLRRLDFLIGDSSGPGVMFLPELPPVQFTGYLHAEREQCERFLRMEFFGQIPVLGTKSTHSLITYSEKLNCFKMWCFSSTQEEPMQMQGDFQGRSLVFVSDPVEMRWGFERIRCSFTPLAEGVVDYFAELWSIDGYVPYFRATYREASIRVR